MQTLKLAILFKGSKNMELNRNTHTAFHIFVCSQFFTFFLFLFYYCVTLAHKNHNSETIQIFAVLKCELKKNIFVHKCRAWNN